MILHFPVTQGGVVVVVGGGGGALARRVAVAGWSSRQLLIFMQTPRQKSRCGTPTLNWKLFLAGWTVTGNTPLPPRRGESGRGTINGT